LQAFAQNESDDLASPHAYANKRALADVTQRLNIKAEPGFDLSKVPLADLQQAARSALIADTQQHEAAATAH
jgi:hypothetical protein